jgi:hypothetical protein
VVLRSVWVQRIITYPSKQEVVRNHLLGALVPVKYSRNKAVFTAKATEKSSASILLQSDIRTLLI